jgi:hypothetical protein
LKRAKIEHLSEDSVQYIELKRAFFAACGQLLIMQRDEISEIENEDEAVEVYQKQTEEIFDFWENEAATFIGLKK